MASHLQSSSVPPSVPLPSTLRNLHHSSPVHSYGYVELRKLPRQRHARATPVSDPVPLNLDISSRFGQRLRDLRLQRNLTQCEMAKRFGIDRSFISDVERGRKSISLGLLEVLSLGLKLSLSEMFRDV